MRACNVYGIPNSLSQWYPMRYSIIMVSVLHVTATVIKLNQFIDHRIIVQYHKGFNQLLCLTQ